jgi:RHS repeat-associated protein
VKQSIGGSTVENNLRFPGQYFDAETGFHYNWHRYYIPELGRCNRLDPIKDDRNWYGYVGGNSLVRFDFDGRQAHERQKFNETVERRWRKGYADWINGTINEAWDQSRRNDRWEHGFHVYSCKRVCATTGIEWWEIRVQKPQRLARKDGVKIPFPINKECESIRIEEVYHTHPEEKVPNVSPQDVWDAERYGLNARFFIIAEQLIREYRRGSSSGHENRRTDNLWPR